MSFKYIDKVGYEGEGGWDKPPKQKLINDASISAGDFYESQAVGELVSEPFSDRQELLDALKETWPTEVNDKCGFHVHFSLKDIVLYSHLMTPQFYDYFIKAITKWGETYPCTNPMFLERLKGKHRFCLSKFIPDKQIHAKEKSGSDRYTHLNYCWSFHKTIECRLFPMFVHHQTGQSAVEALINCVENYFEELPVNDKPIVASLEEDEAEPIIIEENDKYSSFKKSSIKIKPFNLFAEIKKKKKLEEVF